MTPASPAGSTSRMRALRFIVPLAIFLILVAFLGVGLSRDPREVPSPLIDKAAPAGSARCVSSCRSRSS